MMVSELNVNCFHPDHGSDKRVWIQIGLENKILGLIPKSSI